MSDLKEVYVNDSIESTEITPEYVYVTIPADYVCTYNKLLVLMSQLGVDMLNDCNASCTKRNKNVIDCFNMFNAAVAARKLGQDKIAETLLKYINAQIKLLNNNTDVNPNVVWPVDPDGYIKAVVSCGDNPKFYIDSKTGELLQMGKSNQIYALDNTDVESDD